VSVNDDGPKPSGSSTGSKHSHHGTVDDALVSAYKHLSTSPTLTECKHVCAFVLFW